MEYDVQRNVESLQLKFDLLGLAIQEVSVEYPQWLPIFDLGLEYQQLAKALRTSLGLQDPARLPEDLAGVEAMDRAHDGE